jgi:hypothetical protein
LRADITPPELRLRRKGRSKLRPLQGPTQAANDSDDWGVNYGEGGVNQGKCGE